MSEVITIQDLETLKKHEIFEAEVITGRAGGLAAGVYLATATNQVTGQTQDTLPQILSDLGMQVQPWSSSVGGVLTNASQIFLNDTVGSLGIGDYYAWAGPFPKTVPAGVDPAIPGSGYILRSSKFVKTSAREALRRTYAEAGYTLVAGSFEVGGTVTSSREVLYYEADGKAYSWGGALPKSVTAGSTPQTSGGFGINAWHDKSKTTSFSAVSVGEFELIAHASSIYLAPENSMSGYTNAISLGITSLEGDLHVSSDGVPVMIHDTTVDRTTNGTGAVSSLTFAQLRALDSSDGRSAKLSPARIPSFDEFLKFAHVRAKYVYPEIKGYRTQSDINLMMDVVDKYRVWDKVIWQSFNISDLQFVRARDEISGVGFLGFDISSLESVANLGGRMFYLVDYNFILNNPAAVEQCRSAGVDVGVWTVDNGVNIQQLLDLGVTKIMSNRYYCGGF